MQEAPLCMHDVSCQDATGHSPLMSSDSNGTLFLDPVLTTSLLMRLSIDLSVSQDGCCPAMGS